MSTLRSTATAISLAAVALMTASAAQAATLISFNSSSPLNSATDFSVEGLAAADLDFKTLAPITLVFAPSTMELAEGTVRFNSVVRNLFGGSITAAGLTLSGATFAQAGTVEGGGFGAVPTVSSNATHIGIQFLPAENFEFYVGDPLNRSGQRDWVISLDGLSAGQTFSITTAVPEPSAVLMMLAGMALVAGAARRRSN